MDANQMGRACIDAAVQKCVETPDPTVVREYDIGGVKYVVTAAVKAGAAEDAAAKIRRMIRNDLRTGKYSFAADGGRDS